jgi:hypothetical protein
VWTAAIALVNHHDLGASLSIAFATTLVTVPFVIGLFVLGVALLARFGSPA